MKKLVSVIAIVAALFCLYSCKEACEKNNTGDLTIQNNTDQALWFSIDAKGATFDPRNVPSGGSTSYTIPSGFIDIYTSMSGNSEDYYFAKQVTLTRCAQETFSTPAGPACEWFNVTDIRVINNTGFGTTFDVWVTDVGFLGEVYINYGNSYTYTNIPANTARFWIYIEGSWYYYPASTYITLLKCLHTFTWNAKKDMELVIGDKMNMPEISNPIK